MKLRQSIQLLPIDSLHEYEGNAKKHDEKQIKILAEGIKKFGFNVPILIDQNKEIIAGHGRLYAARKLNLKEVPCILIDDLTDEEVQAFRLADNQINAMTGFDMSAVVKQLRFLDSKGFDIDLTGFDRDLIISPDEKDDGIPENAPTRAKLGDIWILGKHRVMCGDSTKKEEVEKLMDGKKADMVFTDPPYGIGLTGKKNYSSKKRNTESEDYDKIIGDDTEFDMTKVFENIQSPKWWVWGADYLYRTIPNFQKGNLVVWAKRHSEEENKVFGSAFELCWVYPYCKKEIWFIRAINQSNEALHIHPTQKPTELAVRALSRNSEIGNIIVDVFLGSGSTLIASQKTGRICYGMELDEKYCDVIIKRWEDYTGLEAIKVV